eukprot:TRINITY_DN116912_c0_g1_i1.p1 TRINITY_DN116912_c0_g1~~TRINITY_DN116912_c0_g1_i1.p1  ORF type:complete len:189 (-),score=15.96 TRINITY_DN116912_c0_g1_i1:53-568(-)
MGDCESFLVGPEPETVQGANGTLRKGARVQTQWTRDEGGNDRWYKGTVQRLFKNDRVRIYYDDGDRWTGWAGYVWDLTGQPPPELAGGVAGVPVVQGMIMATATPAMPQIPQSELATANEEACPVCQANRMDMVLQCGHRLCGTCLKDIQKQGNLCPVCRSPIAQVIRLYN